MATIFYTVDLKTRVFKIKLEKKTITLKEFKDITNRYNYTFFRAISSDDFSQRYFLFINFIIKHNHILNYLYFRQILFYSIDDNEELKGVVELYLRSKPSNDISFNIAPLEKAISHGYVTSRLKSNVSESNNVNRIFKMIA